MASYVIQECHEEFENSKGCEGKSWKDYKINEVGYVLAAKSMLNVMLDEDNEVLVPFSYGF